uniref:Uncharacterized protein n=1 Tax=Chromera velia CCMP2878 TaxID=1169474 RepID=A0A0G4I7C7_9ALVE|eukprot:Cvel_11568.t1-p1 / transcript=Cvel_11568.t1 / gene=Cvel_11568 / organism=Chromera_velia_CCMP2878 / gene_product=hypothetical protein / transcript_product=hypothetical protein / location=Cvel_scaffold731:27857-33776(-) / protein_length=565 / sequence_SO=supercontig / SO=protein_coding / is_pseudo=false
MRCPVLICCLVFLLASDKGSGGRDSSREALHRSCVRRRQRGGGTERETGPYLAFQNLFRTDGSRRREENRGCRSRLGVGAIEETYGSGPGMDVLWTEETKKQKHALTWRANFTRVGEGVGGGAAFRIREPYERVAEWFRDPSRVVEGFFFPQYLTRLDLENERIPTDVRDYFARDALGSHISESDTQSALRLLRKRSEERGQVEMEKDELLRQVTLQETEGTEDFEFQLPSEKQGLVAKYLLNTGRKLTFFVDSVLDFQLSSPLCLVEAWREEEEKKDTDGGDGPRKAKIRFKVSKPYIRGISKVLGKGFMDRFELDISGTLSATSVVEEHFWGRDERHWSSLFHLQDFLQNFTSIEVDMGVKVRAKTPRLLWNPKLDRQLKAAFAVECNRQMYGAFKRWESDSIMWAIRRFHDGPRVLQAYERNVLATYRKVARRPVWPHIWNTWLHAWRPGPDFTGNLEMLQDLGLIETYKLMKYKPLPGLGTDDDEPPLDDTTIAQTNFRAQPSTEQALGMVGEVYKHGVFSPYAPGGHRAQKPCDEYYLNFTAAGAIPSYREKWRRRVDVS